MTNNKRLWIIDVRPSGKPPLYLGKVEATLAEIRKACGPSALIVHYPAPSANHVTIWGRP